MNLHQEFNEFIKERGLRQSDRREIVASTFFTSDDHISVEELASIVKKVDPKIGIATVYRTLNLLVECGLALKRDFENGPVLFEKRPDHHHDHMICSACKSVVEFVQPEIESLQDAVAKQHGFTLTSHRMELYGICKSCS